jgi:hypothetical protein
MQEIPLWKRGIYTEMIHFMRLKAKMELFVVNEISPHPSFPKRG